jgi:hypothetical protein
MYSEQLVRVVIQFSARRARVSPFVWQAIYLETQNMLGVRVEDSDGSAVLVLPIGGRFVPVHAIDKLKKNDTGEQPWELDE